MSEKNIERIKVLSGGIAVQNHLAFQREYFVACYGKDAAKTTPPISKILKMGVPAGGETDKTLGGMTLFDENSRLDHETALYL